MREIHVHVQHLRQLHRDKNVNLMLMNHLDIDEEDNEVILSMMILHHRNPCKSIHKGKHKWFIFYTIFQCSLMFIFRLGNHIDLF
jgi:hypothetical protein